MPGPASLRLLHQEVDEVANRLAQIHAERLRCRRGCDACCVDDLTVFEVEAELIRREHSHLLQEGKPHATGACAFLDRHGACRIYENRPYVCRTQGLPLRWISESEEGETVEYRDICPLNDVGGPAIESLPDDDCFLLGPYESRLRALQDEPGAREKRVALRGLFQS